MGRRYGVTFVSQLQCQDRSHGDQNKQWSHMTGAAAKKLNCTVADPEGEVGSWCHDPTGAQVRALLWPSGTRFTLRSERALFSPNKGLGLPLKCFSLQKRSFWNQKTLMGFQHKKDTSQIYQGTLFPISRVPIQLKGALKPLALLEQILDQPLKPHVGEQGRQIGSI